MAGSQRYVKANPQPVQKVKSMALLVPVKAQGTPEPGLVGVIGGTVFD